jgi:hypothetical protein
MMHGLTNFKFSEYILFNFDFLLLVVDLFVDVYK